MRQLLSKSKSEFSFLANKVHIHRWPHDTPKWSVSRKQQIEQEINQNKSPKHVTIAGKTLSIESFTFDSIQKIGITIPLFKKQSTVIFEGHCEEFDAHVHITTKSDDYLETFNHLMNWRKTQFPNSFYIE